MEHLPSVGACMDIIDVTGAAVLSLKRRHADRIPEHEDVRLHHLPHIMLAIVLSLESFRSQL